ncbi:MAG: phosphate--acyl-ACP acyltransferase, partial [Clostridiales bacterium]|nr:phosphate--acyl-ACP acyltransferase [Clostridiales bacterium]
PEYLVQFAYLGSAYMECVMGVENPRVALLNNGAESHKGTPTLVEANKMLRNEASLNFVGNVEGKDVPFGTCDVVVADGFAGNVMLKTSEGMCRFVMLKMKEKVFGGIGGKISSVLKGNDIKDLDRFFDAKEYGGAPFLGLSKPVIKAHGDSDAKAVCAAIEQAIKYVDTGVIDKISVYAEKFPKAAPGAKSEG